MIGGRCPKVTSVVVREKEKNFQTDVTLAMVQRLGFDEFGETRPPNAENFRYNGQ